MVKFDKIIYVNLGKQLRKAREQKGMSLDDVAEKVGLSKKTIQRYELAESRISNENLKKLVKVLGLDNDIVINSLFFNLLTPNKRKNFTTLVYEAAQRIQNISDDDLIKKLAPDIKGEEIEKIKNGEIGFDDDRSSKYRQHININLTKDGFSQYEELWYSGEDKIFLGRTKTFNSTSFSTIEDYATAVAERVVDRTVFDSIENNFLQIINHITSDMDLDETKVFFTSLTDYAFFKSQEMSKKEK